MKKTPSSVSARWKASPRAAGEESIDVRFTYDLNGILEVEARVTSTGATSAMVIEPRGGRLGPDQVRAARAAMARLKLHPRDALPNTTALARADALYVELAGPPRERLGQAIGSFRAALERQEPADVELLRRHLLELLDGLRRG